MMRTLKKLLQGSAALPAANRRKRGEHDITLAVTALMIEVMMMDGRLDAAERDEIVARLKQRFGLLREEAEEMIARAAKAADAAHDLYQFTSRIIREYPLSERAAIIRELWRVAMADGHVDAYEEQLIRKIAGLIGVAHRDFIDAKIEAKEEG